MNRAERRQSPEHVRAAELLPWYVNGTLQASESDAVKRHLRVCRHCSEEQIRLALLQTTMQDDAPTPVAANSAVPFNSLLTRIDDTENLVRPGKSEKAQWWTDLKLQGQGVPAVWKWVCALQAGAIALLCIALVPSNTQLGVDPLYHTVSEPDSGVAVSDKQFRVVFAETTAEAQIRSLLLSLPAEIVAGPSAHGVYTVALASPRDGTSTDTAPLERLRASKVVDLAEPIFNEP